MVLSTTSKIHVTIFHCWFSIWLVLLLSISSLFFVFPNLMRGLIIYIPGMTWPNFICGGQNSIQILSLTKNEPSFYSPHTFPPKRASYLRDRVDGPKNSKVIPWRDNMPITGVPTMPSNGRKGMFFMGVLGCVIIVAWGTRSGETLFRKPMNKAARNRL